MPVRSDLEAATRAASVCLDALICLLLAADVSSPAEWREPGRIAKALGLLARAFPWAWRAIPAAEFELTLAASGPVSIAGLTCPSGHRWVLEYAELLGEAILRIDARLLPIAVSSPGDGSGPDVEIVTANLPAILATLAAMPPFEPGEIQSRMQHEWVRVQERLKAPIATPTIPTGVDQEAMPGHGTKGNACLNMYLQALARGEEPPGATEIARHVGCNRATAWRAIKPLEDQYKKMNRADARQRHLDKGGPVSARNK
jgi:hypothetical protein